MLYMSTELNVESSGKLFELRWVLYEGSYKLGQ